MFSAVELLAEKKIRRRTILLTMAQKMERVLKVKQKEQRAAQEKEKRQELAERG